MQEDLKQTQVRKGINLERKRENLKERTKEGMEGLTENIHMKIICNILCKK